MNGGEACLRSLSNREREVAACLVEGASYASTARLLCLSPATVHSHAKRIYRKAGVHSRHELMERCQPGRRCGARALPLEAAAGPLAPREQDVAACLTQGMTRRQAAQHLGLSPETVKAYARSLFCKLGIRSRDELFELAHSERRTGART